VSSEALPIFLQDLMPRYVAILSAAVLVIVFGEVLPTVLFTGPNQLAIASRWAPFVKCIMCLLYPVAAPIARVLDHVHHDKDTGNMYNRGELAALIRIQYEERMAFHQRKKNDLNKNTKESPNRLASSLKALKGEFNRNYPEGLPSIASDEINMVEGALQMKMKVAMDIYCPLDKVFAIPSDTILDETNIVRIYGSAYSRIPIYDRRQNEFDKRAIRGIFMSRQLIMAKPEKKQPLSSLRMHVPFCISPKMNLVDLVGLFQTGGSGGRGGHMALVCARPDVGNEALDRNEAVPDEAILMG
jgi:metal transporter CNNM